MPKNQPLEYQSNVPAFLQRIKAGNTALDGRHNVQIPRARGGMSRGGRLDMKGEEGDDDPVMLDEAGNVVSKEEIEALEDTPSDKVQEKTNGDAEEPQVVDGARKARDDSNNVSSGFAKKRKAAKVVANDEPTDVPEKEGTTNEPVKPLKESTKDLHNIVAQNREDAKKEGTTTAGARKKRKMVKLSFDEPE